MANERELRTMLAGKTAPGGGLALMALGAATLVAGVVGAVSWEETTLGVVSLLVASGTLGLGLIRAGQILLVEKGGIDFDPGAGTVRFRGVGRRDTLVLPVDELTGVRLVPRDEVWGREPTRNWSCELLRSGAAVVVGESTDYDALWGVARKLEGETKRKLTEGGSWSAPPREAARRELAQGTRQVRPRAGGPLFNTLLAIGVVGVAVGAAAMTQVAASPIFGFLFGPTLLFLGLAFGGVALSARLAEDVIEWDGESVRHHRRLGPLRWGARSLPGAGPLYVRLFHRGLRGATLELVGAEQTLVLVGGICRSSALGYDGLRRLADELAEALSLTDAVDSP